MSVKIRLKRKGKKDSPFYHIVIADSRSPRDGRYIEKLGSYDPQNNTNKININSDLTISWLDKGAIPSETVRNLLSKEGVLYKRHLLKGVSKNVLTQDQVDEKFSKWVREKEMKKTDSKIRRKKSKMKSAPKPPEAVQGNEENNQKKTDTNIKTSETSPVS